ncbi:MAG: nucleotidyltransferase family protein [Fibrobacterota bacterium]
MRGFVLAAGFGTRLKPITDMIPKALVPVCGVPLAEIALRWLRKNGIYDLAMNIHYHSDIMRMFADQMPYDITLFEEQPEIRGTGGAIYNARDFLAGDDSFAVINADIITDVSLLRIEKDFRESSADIVLIAKTGGEHASVLSDDDGLYCGPVSVSSASGCRADSFIGLSLYKRKALDQFCEDDFSVLPVWKRAAGVGLRVEVWRYDDIYWRDTGTPAQYLRAYRDILDRRIRFDFPLAMNVDFDRKAALHESLSPKQLSQNSEYVWCERVAASGIDAENSVFFGGVKIDPERSYRNTIVTPWCEVAIEQ